MDILLDTLKWSLIIGAAALVLSWLKPALDKRYRPRWRYQMWLVMAALLLLAPVQWEALLPAVETVKPPVVVEVPYRQVTVGDMTGIRTQTYRSGQDPEQVLPANRGEIGLFTTSSREELASAYRTVGVTIKAETILTALWLAGMAAFLLYHLVGTLWLGRRARRWSWEAGQETWEVYTALGREMGIDRLPRLLISGGVDSPMVLGLLRPCLLLPTEGYEERELRFILRHELTHCKRRDLWYKLVLLLANAVHWFNPLVYLLAREAGADMELTCDDAVVAGADAETRRAYSETLLASIHRQTGLGRSALSTHFYGGTEVMKDRFRNILGRPGRKRGAVVLALALVLTVAVACSVGLQETELPDPQEPAGEPLTEEEVAQWQEKLSSMELNGFVARLYTDVRYLPLYELLYDGAGISYSPAETEREAVVEAWGYDPDTDILAISRSDVQAFLETYTGYGIEDFRGMMGNWTALEGSDNYYTAHGDTNYCFVNVLSGTKAGDTVTLELELPGGNMNGGVTGGVMTIVDGKIRSFTNDLYTAVEAMAWDLVNGAARSLETSDWIIPAQGETVPEGPEIVDSYISGLWSYSSYEIGDKTYSVWWLEYRLKPDDINKVMLAGGMSEVNGWVTETSSMGSPVIFVSVDSQGKITQEQVTYDSVRWENGWTWEEYIYCGLYLGMDMGYRLGGWPELTTPFVTERLEYKSAWSDDRDEVVRRCLSQMGKTVDETAVLRTFDVSTSGDADQSVLMAAKCGDETFTLLMSHIVYPVESWNGVAKFWMVHSILWPDGTTQPPGGEDTTLLKTDFVLTEGKTGSLYLYGRQFEDGSYGVSKVEIFWNEDSGGYAFHTREAILAEQGEDSMDYHTRSDDEDGGLQIGDVNGDGYADIGLQAAAGGSTCYYWLYNAETGKFDYGFSGESVQSELYG